MDFDNKITLVTLQGVSYTSLEEHVKAIKVELMNSQISLEGERVGIGSTSNVYKVIDPKTMRTVAIKRLQKELGADEGFLESFVREAQITAQLEHPNIIPVYDFGKDLEGNFYYTMKYIEGETLQEILEKISKGDDATSKAYPLQRLITIFLDVCNAVSYANSHGVFHKDLTPGNFLIGDFGNVYVINWGLGTIPSEKKYFSKSSFYKAPEYKSGAERDSTEVYSLGAILYSILTQKVPENQQITDECLQEIYSEDVKLSKNLQVDFPAGRLHALILVMQKALLASPVGRYKNVLEMSMEVQKWQQGFVTDVEDAGFVTSLLLMVKRNRRLSVILIFSFFSLVVMSGLFYNSISLEKKDTDDWNKRVLSEQNRIEVIRSELIQKNKQLDAKITELRYTAPVYMANAYSKLQEGDLEEALKYIRYSCVLDPENEDYRLAKAHLLQLSFKFNKALESYRQCSLPAAEVNSAFIESFIHEKISWYETVFKLKKHLREEDRVLHGRYLEVLIDSKEKELQQIWNKEIIGTSLEGYAKKLLIQQGRIILDLSHSKIKSFPKLNTPITELNLSQSSLVEFDNISNLPLEKLDISRTNITDISSLRESSISHLNLSESSIENLTIIASFKKLKFLDISHRKNSDFSFLESLKLKELHLNYTGVASIDFVKDMSLESLSLLGSRVTDLSPLKGQPLKTFFIESKQLTSLGFLEEMPLENFELKNSLVTSLNPLYLANLKNVKIVKCPISDLEVLREAPLRRLHIEDTNISDISWVRDKNINELVIENSPVADISALKDLPIARLIIPGTLVDDLSPVRSISFETIIITSTKVKSLDSLDGVPVITLHMRHTEIDSFKPLKTTDTQYIYASGCKNLTSLKGLENLELRDLSVDDTSIANLNFFPAKVVNLNLAGSKVKDISPLKGRGLLTLNLTNCNIDDFSVLLTLKKLYAIYLPRHFSQSNILRQMPNLQKIKYRGRSYTPAEFFKEHP